MSPSTKSGDRVDGQRLDDRIEGFPCRAAVDTEAGPRLCPDLELRVTAADEPLRDIEIAVCVCGQRVWRVELIRSRQVRALDSCIAAQRIGPSWTIRPNDACAGALTRTDVVNEVALESEAREP